MRPCSQLPQARSAPPVPAILGLMLIAAGCFTPCSPLRAADDPPFWRRIVEQRLEKIRSGEVRAPLLRRQQVHTLTYVHYGSAQLLTAQLPDREEVELFVSARAGNKSQALDFLDELFGERDDLKALAVRDSDEDGVPDYRISDYFGKFMEGDVDLDGDGIRNVVDSHPLDPGRGGRDGNGDGIPDVAGSFPDVNTNGVPDHMDWGLRDRDPAFEEIQRRMLLEHGIALVERNAAFDLPLLRAVDDAVGKVFRAWFERVPVMPTLRTIAVEDTALLGRMLSTVADDNTSAQVFSQTQSLTVYGDGRAGPHAIGLLGLLVHEIGHNYHMALDFDTGDLPGENGRTVFRSPAFIRMIAPFGWLEDGYYEGEFARVPPVTPRFAYTGISEPLFSFRGRTPEDWSDWLLEVYDRLGQPADYLERKPFADQYIVSDYSLTSPYEWYGDNLLAYVVELLEREIVAMLVVEGRGEEIADTSRQITESIREIWPGFFHGNIDPGVYDHFEALFPVLPGDRRDLAHRYMFPLLERPPG